MRTTKGRGAAVTAALAVLLLLAPVPSTLRATAAGAAASFAPTAFHADVALRRGVVSLSASGLDARFPTTTFHLERRLRDGRWRSVFTVTSSTRPPFVSPSGTDEPIPPLITRVEDDGDGTEVRVYGKDGLVKDAAGERDRIRASVGAAAGEAVAGDAAAGDATAPGAGEIAGSDWVEALRPSSARRAARRLALRQRFGTGGTLGAFDRFVLFRDGDTVEILADREWSVPVEINVLRDGVLDRHTVFTYDAVPEGLLRRGMRSEHRLAGSEARREIVELELTNVRFEGAK